MKKLNKLFIVCSLILASALGAKAQVNVTMWQKDLQHTGANLNETILTPGNISSPGNFGLLYTQPTDGQTYGQPLLVSGVNVSGTTHNLVFVATEHDSIYAFDADNNTGTNSTFIWHQSLLPAGTVPVPQSVVGSGDISVELGITTTPVIDTTSSTIYIVSKVQKTSDTTYHQYLHALDLATGAEKFGGPVEINPTFAGSSNDGTGGVIPFSALHEHLRAAMILYNGIVYLSYASHSDTTPYHGEILGYNASTLALTKTFITTPNGNNPEGGLWGAGAGPAIDGAGNMYIAVANGAFDQTASPYTTGTNWGESMLKLPTTGTFNVSFSNTLNWFTPNIWNTLNGGDLDLGSSGLLLLPDQAAGPHQHILVGGGKGAVLYVVDRDNMGGLHTPDNAIQEIPEINGDWLFVTPAYFNGNIYYSPAGGPLEQRAVGYNATDGSYISTTAITSADVFNGKGSGAFISANGATNGIVWILTGGGIRAYNATNVSGAPIYSANSTVPPNTGTQNTKFSLPMVANGKVYYTGYEGATNIGHLFVYGLLPAPVGTPAAPSSAAASAISSSQITVTWTDNSTNESGFKVKRSTSAAGPFTQVGATTGANVTAFTDTGLTPQTTYYYQVVATNANGDSNATNVASDVTFPIFAPAGLVAYWNLDDTSASTVTDATGNAHTGSVNGEVVSFTGLINGCFDFHGTGFATSNITVANKADLQFTAAQSFTISAWVNPSALRSSDEAIIAKSADQGNEYGIWISAANKWVFRGPGGDLVGTAVTESAWAHVAAVQDGTAGTRKLYVNGTLVATGTAQAADGAGAFWMGQQNVSATPDSFPGLIDEVRVYNRALAATEITTLIGPPVLEASSNQVQGTAGQFGLVLAPSSVKVIEPRKGSTAGAYSIELSFSAPVATGITASLALQSGGTAVGTAGTASYDSTGKIVTIPLTGVGNAQALNLHLTGIKPVGGTLAGTADVPINILLGDVDSDNVVGGLDVKLVSHNHTSLVNASTAFYDLNCDGKVDAADDAIVSGATGNNLGTQTDSNLALFQPATATTPATGNIAANAFDNNVNTRWESASADPQSITVDLGTTSTVHSIVLNWENAAGASYDLQISADNATWTNLRPTITGNTTGGIKSYTGLSGVGRYVRMAGYTRTTQFGYSLWEFQVFGIPNGTGGGGSAPVITSATTATGTVGTAFTYQTTASNTPTGFAETGTLPAGLTFSTTTGAITGTPTTAGTSTINLTASNGNGTSPAVALTITIGATGGGSAPVITSATTAAGTVGTAFTYQTTASNTPTSFAETGALPGGLTFSTTTGAITGTPTAAGTSTINLTASNGSGTSPAVGLTITIGAGGGTTPVITSATTASGVQNGLFTYQITATNAPTSYGATNLPTGVTLNATTGYISGTPTAAGTSTISLTGINANGTGAATTLTLTVAANTDTNLALTKTATATSVTGGNTAAMANDGNAGTRWESLYADPQSITVDLGSTSTVHTIVLDWETAAGASYDLQISPDNATWTNLLPTITGNTTGGAKVYSGLSGTGRYVRMAGYTRATQYGYSLWEFQIFGVSGGAPSAPVITSATTAAGTVGTAFTYQTTASNTPTSFAETGTLPAGLTFSTTTGAITGTPTAAGTSTINLTATNATGTSPAVALTITIGAGGGTTPAITSPTTAAALQNGIFTYQTTASNAPTSYGITGTIPPGLTFNTTTGFLSGTPTTAGTSTVTLTGTNANGTGAGTALTITVAANTETNLALAGTASATSVTGAQVASFANDGNGGTRWESLYTDPQTITIDLGAVDTVHNIVLDWENAAAANYSLQISSDNATWTNIVPAIVGNTTGGAKLFSGLSATGRYVRMAGTTRITGYGYSIWEFQIFGVTGTSPIPAITSATTASATVGSAFTYQTTATNTPTSFAETGTLPAGVTFSTTTGLLSGTPTTAGTSTINLTATNGSGTSPAVTLTITVAATGDTNVALSKTATASSVQAGNATASGNDGSATTRWAAADGTFPQWWMVDLGANKTLSHVDINWFSNTTRAYKYKIETSTDNATYTLYKDNTANTAFGATSDSNVATARYVKITVNGATAGFASFYEAAVFGH